MPKCTVCHNGCNLKDGDLGLCQARTYKDGSFQCANYGKITSIALDPIEKKPLYLFHPGSRIVSVGSFGCNLRCPFCQNHEISYGFGNSYEIGYRYISPQELASIAVRYVPEGNIGIAFTYNEPLVGYEYVVDAAKEVHRAGLKTVLVSNGCVSEEIADIVIPHIDAMNIDLKGYSESYYHNFLGGSREMVMNFISRACKLCHMEITTLIVPTYNDSESEIEEIASWIASLNDGHGKTEIALHLNRYFPRFRLTNIPAPDYQKMEALKKAALRHIENVFVGN